MRIGIDYTSAVRQHAGIGRYTRGLVSALLDINHSHQYRIFAATGGLPDHRWAEAAERLRSVRDRQLWFHTVPITDDWLARLWHRVRLPIPIELITGPLDVFYSPDFTLPPTMHSTHTVLTVHDLSFVHHPEAFVPQLCRYLERAVPRSVRRADVVLADSAHTRADLLALFGIPQDKVEVITPGVDSRFHARSATAAALGRGRFRTETIGQIHGVGDSPYILSVGTLQPRKNYVRLIQAFARMRQARSSDVQLLIAGGRGWLFEDVIVEADKHDSVRLLGFVEDEELSALYRDATLFAFPSLYEGFGLPVLEAMACGTPVVCSNSSSLPEVAGDAALLVDPEDVAELSTAMDRVLEDPELRATMIDRGLAQATRFTWKRSARQLLDVITSWEGT